MEVFRRDIRIGEENRTAGVKVYSVKEAEAILRKRGGERASFLQSKTIGVDFSETPSYTDPNEATMCIVVLTSNGRTGTLSHLTPETDNVPALADSILRYHGEPASACFVGGTFQVSDQLLDSLYRELSRRDFAVPSETNQADIGGVFNNRVATLFTDKVIVKKYYEDYPPEQIQLEFPKRIVSTMLPRMQG